MKHYEIRLSETEEGEWLAEVIVWEEVDGPDVGVGSPLDMDQIAPTPGDALRALALEFDHPRNEEKEEE